MSEGTYDSGKIIEAIYESAATSSEVTRITVDTNSTVLLAFNSTRNQIILQNTGSPLFIKLGLGASQDLYSFSLSANAMASVSSYGGPITAVRANTTDDVFITEIY